MVQQVSVVVMGILLFLSFLLMMNSCSWYVNGKPYLHGVLVPYEHFVVQNEFSEFDRCSMPGFVLLDKLESDCYTITLKKSVC